MKKVLKITQVLLSLMTLTLTNETYEQLSVRTKLGVITGTIKEIDVFGKRITVERYFGIPYAEPPVGDLRFRKSVPKRPFTEPYKADKHGDICFQIVSPYQFGPTTSEDCLHLNLYVPAKNGGNLAVLISIHGGGFMSGASNPFISDTLAAYGDVIVVTINYRVSLWGFLSTGDEHAPGNYGFWDKHLAIKWVHDNIDSFGGDPNRITIIGESAGAVSAVFQCLFEGNKGLFQGAISMSGSITSALFPLPQNPKQDAEKLGKLVGCENMDSAPLIQCLRSKPADVINATVNDFNNGFFSFPMPFIPGMDGEFIKDTFDDLLNSDSKKSKEGRSFFSSIDLLGGIDAEEGVIFLGLIKGVLDTENLEPNRTDYEEQLIPRALSALGTDVPEVIKDLVAHEYTDWSDPEDMKKRLHKLTAIVTDTFFSLSLLETIARHESLAKDNRGTYMFVFDVEPSRHLLQTPTWSKRATHGDELLYLFLGESNEIGKAMTGEDYKPENWEIEVARYIMDMWSNFAKTG